MAAWWATMSLFRFGFTWKSLDTVTKSEDIQATQQLNSTNEPGYKGKLNLNQKSSLGKANEIENTKRHGSKTFLGLYAMKKTTPWSAKFAVLYLELLTNLALCSLETVPLGALPFRPMLKVKLTLSVLKQNLLGKTPLPHLGEQCCEIWMPRYECTSKRKTAKLFNSAYFISKVFTAFFLLCTLSINDFKKPPTKAHVL